MKGRKERKEEELTKLSGTLQHLEHIGLEINKSLHTQNELATELEEKTDQVNDLALATLLRSAQLTQRAKKSVEVFIGDYCFYDQTTNRYLSVHGSNLILSPLFDRSTLFRVYAKESHIMGIQSHLTLRYIGVNLWGKVVVTSSIFGSYEETYIDLDGYQGFLGVLFLASNWNGGGWLQIGEPVESTSSTTNVNDSFCTYCTTVTTSITDKRKKVELKAILIPPDSVNNGDEEGKKNSIWKIFE